VLLVHQWKGLGDYEKKRAEMLARLGYNVFCVDIYGKGIRPDNPKEAAAEAGKYKSNRPLLRARVNAGLDVLRKHELTDPKLSNGLHHGAGTSPEGLSFVGKSGCKDGPPVRQSPLA